METFEVFKYYLLIFFMWVVVLIIVNLIRETYAIINNGNTLTDGRCCKNCR